MSKITITPFWGEGGTCEVEIRDNELPAVPGEITSQVQQVLTLSESKAIRFGDLYGFGSHRVVIIRFGKHTMFEEHELAILFASARAEWVCFVFDRSSTVYNDCPTISFEGPFAADDVTMQVVVHKLAYRLSSSNSAICHSGIPLNPETFANNRTRFSGAPFSTSSQSAIAGLRLSVLVDTERMHHDIDHLNVVVLLSHRERSTCVQPAYATEMQARMVLL